LQINPASTQEGIMEDAWIGKVLAAGLALLFAWIVFTIFVPVGFITVLAVIGAIVWIAKGSTK
jgi:hypothetical protein